MIYLESTNYFSKHLHCRPIYSAVNYPCIYSRVENNTPCYNYENGILLVQTHFINHFSYLIGVLPTKTSYSLQLYSKTIDINWIEQPCFKLFIFSKSHLFQTLQTLLDKWLMIALKHLCFHHKLFMMRKDPNVIHNNWKVDIWALLSALQ